MKLIGKILKQEKRSKRIGKTHDLYQNSVEQFGRDQLTRLAEKGLNITLGAV
jgi:hypothetical protein